MLFNVSDASISLSSVVTFADPQLSAQQVTLKKDAPPAELEKAKQEARNSGGTIKHEYTLIKGFTYVPYISPPPLLQNRTHQERKTNQKPTDHSTKFISPIFPSSRTADPQDGASVEYPDDHVKVLQTTEHLHVEQDGEVHTK
ncbi:hypothetical protein FQN51_009342 [Onygenales sp. PD_10]|nr:hypothetical protein FQN51_009342 [Onygenales sp. PD_10]